jgi:hypothetical protein
MFAGDEYAASQRPSALASSTCSRPAGLIRPAFVSASIFSTLIFDHLLLERRGVNFCR